MLPGTISKISVSKFASFGVSNFEETNLSQWLDTYLSASIVIKFRLFADIAPKIGMIPRSVCKNVNLNSSFQNISISSKQTFDLIIGPISFFSFYRHPQTHALPVHVPQCAWFFILPFHINSFFIQVSLFANSPRSSRWKPLSATVTNLLGGISYYAENF